MSKYTTLLFDADNTLLDFSLAETTAIKRVCDSFDIAYSEEIRRLYSDINDSLWKQLEKGQITRDIIKIRRFEQFTAALGCSADTRAMADTYIKALSECGMLLKGAKELCEALSKRFDMYIVTNGIATVQKSRLALCGLLPCFNGVFISEEMGSQKPEKRFFDAVFEAITEKDRRKICIIGDSLSSDIQGGINAGIDTCFFCPKNLNLLTTPTYIAESYNEILKIFTETENE